MTLLYKLLRLCLDRTAPPDFNSDSSCRAGVEETARPPRDLYRHGCTVMAGSNTEHMIASYQCIGLNLFSHEQHIQIALISMMEHDTMFVGVRRLRTV